MFCPSCGAENSPTTKFCSSCGTKIDADQGFDQSKPVDQPQPYGQPSSKYIQQPQYHAYGNYSNYGNLGYNYGPPKKRNYFAYIAPVFVGVIMLIGTAFSLVFSNTPSFNIFGGLLGISILVIIGGGIYLLFYYYYNGADFRDMVYYYHQDVYERPQDPAVMLILIFVFRPVFVYFKYQQLHNHVKQLHPEIQPVPTSAWTVFAVIYGPIFLLFVGLFSLFSYNSSAIQFIFILPLISVFGSYYLEYKWQDNMNKHIEFHESPSGQY